MDQFLRKLQRKFGRYAVQRLSIVIIGCFAVGYVISLLSPSMLSYMTLEPYYILKGQIWRIVTWILVPPGSFDLFTLLMLYFYFSIGTTLEKTWGTFRYNVYIFGGLLITVLSAFLTYGILIAVTGTPHVFGSAYSTYYICMSIFLAFAATYPEMQVLLMFVIPIKIKYLGIIYALILLYEVISSLRMFILTGEAYYLVKLIAIVASLANFIIFFFSTRNFNPKEAVRKQQYRSGVARGNRANEARKRSGATYAGPAIENPKVVCMPQQSAKGKPKHRCVICGRTDLSDPDMTFRYCSKCSGGKEYCEEHIFTHTHS